jgi:hypothetical protein
MHDEKLENRSELEAGFGDDGGLAKRVLFKMDSRYVSFTPAPSYCSKMCS